jgi:hypothetical protein
MLPVHMVLFLVLCLAQRQLLGEDSDRMGDWFLGFWAPAGSMSPSWPTSSYDESGGMQGFKKDDGYRGAGYVRKFLWLVVAHNHFIGGSSSDQDEQ